MAKIIAIIFDWNENIRSFLELEYFIKRYTQIKLLKNLLLLLKKFVLGEIKLIFFFK